MCNGNMHVSGMCVRVSAPAKLFTYAQKITFYAILHATKSSLLYH